ncbi:glycosyltransferase [Micromonospora sp. WMMC250]|uniref:glycosyltransferase n=1 Tax=Micromonospora sp. WMMC250 TaxID=3014781 RepID=UPI0022B6D862|nr:glycosyltransferase [Micromonospora sp. WMMC250]MCZ7374016.1 glycosyltransferase [Micromonospora sp. WMMC250]
MTALNAQRAAVQTRPAAAGAVLDVVIPVYNEETDLGPCVRRLHAHLTEHFPYPFRITIADNASVDDTPALADRLATELPGVDVLHLEAKGRGRALSAAWSASSAPVLAYMDVDLSTDLAALLPLVAPLISGHSDLAIGTRLARTSRVVRGAKREVISRAYNLLLRGALAARFSDAQCGFKAIRADVAGELLPLVRDTGWFFDTELLVLAQRAGLRIHEVPVDWVDDPDSRVDIVATALADLRGVGRLGRALLTGALPLTALRAQWGRGPLTVPSGRESLTVSPDRASLAVSPDRASLTGPATQVPVGLPRQLVRFAAVGVASTLAYLVLFVATRGALGAQQANLLALLVTAVGNTAANRRLTFGITGRRHVGRHHVQGLLAFALGLALTSGSLAVLHAVHAVPARPVELAVLVVANLAATVLRFVLLRLGMHHRRG